jgi:hypothetical protein
VVGIGFKSLGVGSGVAEGVGFLVSGSFCSKGLDGVTSELFSCFIFGVDLIVGAEVLLDSEALRGREEIANFTLDFCGVIFDFNKVFCGVIFDFTEVFCCVILDLTDVFCGVTFDFVVGTAGLMVCFLMINFEGGF